MTDAEYDEAVQSGKIQSDPPSPVPPKESPPGAWGSYGPGGPASNTGPPDGPPSLYGPETDYHHPASVVVGAGGGPYGSAGGFWRHQTSANAGAYSTTVFPDDADDDDNRSKSETVAVFATESSPTTSTPEHAGFTIKSESIDPPTPTAANGGTPYLHQNNHHLSSHHAEERKRPIIFTAAALSRCEDPLSAAPASVEAGTAS